MTGEPDFIIIGDRCWLRSEGDESATVEMVSVATGPTKMLLMSAGATKAFDEAGARPMPAERIAH